MLGHLVTRTLAAFLLSITAGMITGKVRAENAELEKCTCDAQRENEPNNGAWVKNAAACWSTEDRGRQWCDITVQSLEGGTAHGAVVGTLFNYQGDIPALVGVFQEQFRQYAASYEAGGHTVPVDMNRALETVPALLKENESRIGECVSAFRNAASGKGGFQTEGGGFRCSVSESSGWLRIEFLAGDFWIAYMLAPNG